MSQVEPMFGLGYKFKTRSNPDRVCTVVDIHRTFNAAGQQVKLRYVVEYFLAGQIIRDADTVQTTILRGEAI